MLVVLLSIFSLCASTSPSFKNTITLQGYADYYGVEPHVLVEQWQDYDWFSQLFPAYVNSSRTTGAARKRRENPEVMMNKPDSDEILTDIFSDDLDNIIRQNIANHMDTNPSSRGGGPGDAYSPQYTDDNQNMEDTGSDRANETQQLKNALNAVSVSLLKVVQYCEDHYIAPVENYRLKRSADQGTSCTANSTNSSIVYSWDRTLGRSNKILDQIDIFCYVFIGIECTLRFIVCPSRKRFFFSLINVLDVLAVLFYIVEVIIYSQIGEGYGVSSFEMLFALRVLRVVRIFRLAKHHKGLQVLVYTIKASVSEIALLFIFLFVGVLFFGSLIYYTDHDDNQFLSIGHCLWWAIITMTTVGYGDMSPSSAAGKVVGAACAVSGVLLIAFTVPVIVNNFTLFYDQVQYGKDTDCLSERHTECPTIPHQSNDHDSAASKTTDTMKNSPTLWDNIEITDV